jgi:GNAT superfamily N-acetyltransferase
MARSHEFDHDRRRQIYEYVERNGAVDPEDARQALLVQPNSSSKPARSGAELKPSVPMASEEFDHHVSILERDGHIEERDGKLRVAIPIDADATTVDVGDVEATVRPAQQEDIAGILGVIETIASDEAYVVARRLAADVTRDEVLLRHNESEDRVFFVATVDDDAVGWLHVEVSQAPNMSHTAELTVGVLDAYRGGGLGSTLMERGLDWARSAGIEKVYQNLPATNDAAISFLEANGWTTESTRGGHDRIDDELVDEVQLAIWLDD